MDLLKPVEPVKGYGPAKPVVPLSIVDPPGKANIEGPAYVLKGDQATLHCSVNDPGKAIPMVTLPGVL